MVDSAQAECLYAQDYTLEYITCNGRRIEVGLQTLYLQELQPVKKATMDIVLAVAVPGGLRPCTDFQWFRASRTRETRGPSEVYRG